MATDITLTIHTASGQLVHTMSGNRLIIARKGDAPSAGRVLEIEDPGLEGRQASINREGARVWILDEGLRGGVLRNGRRVPPRGALLANGDRIFMGGQTNIVVCLGTDDAPRAHDPRPARARRPSQEKRASRWPSPLAFVVTVLFLGGLLTLAAAIFSGLRRTDTPPPPPPVSRTPDTNPTPKDTNDNTHDDTTNRERPPTKDDYAPPPSGAKLYRQMTPEEKLQFLEECARNVSMMIGNRPYAFDDKVLDYIKDYVDAYAKRVGNNARNSRNRKNWGEDLRFVFARARTKYGPHIIRAFNTHNVPPVVGLYIVMIETEFYNFPGQNRAKAAGLFQFIPSTARRYGIDPSERTNVDKMAPAAAKYMAVRIAEFGPDSMSVALAIAGYNRDPDSVRRDLRDVLNSNNRERSFWTLIANSSKLDHYFREENVKYVPKFFAAAIVGENPEAFGLEMRKLSTYTTLPTTPQPDETNPDAQDTPPST